MSSNPENDDRDEHYKKTEIFWGRLDADPVNLLSPPPTFQLLRKYPICGPEIGRIFISPSALDLLYHDIKNLNLNFSIFKTIKSVLEKIENCFGDVSFNRYVPVSLYGKSEEFFGIKAAGKEIPPHETTGGYFGVSVNLPYLIEQGRLSSADFWIFHDLSRSMVTRAIEAILEESILDTQFHMLLAKFSSEGAPFSLNALGAKFSEITDIREETWKILEKEFVTQWKPQDLNGRERHWNLINDNQLWGGLHLCAATSEEFYSYPFYYTKLMKKLIFLYRSDNTEEIQKLLKQFFKDLKNHYQFIQNEYSETIKYINNDFKIKEAQNELSKTQARRLINHPDTEIRAILTSFLTEIEKKIRRKNWKDQDEGDEYTLQKITQDGIEAITGIDFTVEDKSDICYYAITIWIGFETFVFSSHGERNKIAQKIKYLYLNRGLH